MKKTALLIVGGILAVVFVSNMLVGGPSYRVRATNASENKESSRVQDVVSACRRSFNDNFPHQNEIVWEKDSGSLTINLWPNTFGAAEANYALKDTKYLNQWRQMLGSMGQMTTDIKEQFALAGLETATVSINWYDPVESELLLASISNGELIYDVVDATPAGARIGNYEPENKEHEYILNTESKVFHLPGCSAADRIDVANRETVTTSRNSVLSMGYEPCGICTP